MWHNAIVNAIRKAFKEREAVNKVLKPTFKAYKPPINPRVSVDSLNHECYMDYLERKRVYDRQVEELRMLREKFYSENPDHPDKNMFMNVVNPPLRAEFKQI